MTAHDLVRVPREVHALPGAGTEGGLATRPEPAVSAQDYRLELERGMEQWTIKREAIVRYLADHLVEATYDEDGKIVQRNDYYRYPGSAEWKLSQEGADKARAIAGLFTADPRTDVVQSEAAVLTLTCAVHIVESNGTIRGTGQGSATSAEKGFQKQKKTLAYDNDWRAAFHPIQSRALKRATVRGTEAALAFGDVFRRIREERDRGRLGEGRGAATTGDTAGKEKPEAAVRRYRGKPITDLSPGELAAVRERAGADGNDKWVGYVDEELERRRIEATDG
jgi:hypothetical protein